MNKIADYLIVINDELLIKLCEQKNIHPFKFEKATMTVTAGNNNNKFHPSNK